MKAGEWIESRSGLLLRPWQHAVTEAMFPEDGSPSRFETFLLSTVKKAGKTTLNAWCTLYAALHFPAGETAYVIANDAAQAEENIFDLIVAAVREAGLERSGAVIRADRIIFENGTRIIALPADFAGSAGARFGITSWTELWAFRYENHIRQWEELTPIPNRRSLRIVDSYGGFTGDSPVLEPLWQRALNGKRHRGELPIFTNGKLWAFIDQGEDAQRRAWLGDAAEMESYYEEQRATLRAGTFRRLHENFWQQGEEAFLTAEDWDAITTNEYTVPERVPDVRAYVGVDVGLKHDSSAVVAVGWDETGLLLVLAHRIWTPPRRGTLDLASTVEAFLRELAWRFGACDVSYDPSQMQRSAQEMRREQVRMIELPQTTGNLTLATSALFDVVKQRTLRCYEAPDLRQHILNSVVVESPRGWRLAKEKASRKIDAAVALSFAVSAAVSGSRTPVGQDHDVRSGGWAEGGWFGETF